MALENLFIRTKRSIAGIQLDAYLSEDHDSQVDFTRNPVEFGAEITDHAIIQPKKLVLDVQVSDTPLGFEAVNQIVDAASGVFGSTTSGNQTRSTAAYNDIIARQETLQPLEVQTGLKVYNNMGLENVRVIKNKKTSKAVRALLTFTEIIITETEITALTSEQLQEGQTRLQGSSGVDRGRQQANIPDDSTSRTYLLRLTDLLGVSP